MEYFFGLVLKNIKVIEKRAKKVRTKGGEKRYIQAKNKQPKKT